jgi:hypothetical protein
MTKISIALAAAIAMSTATAALAERNSARRHSTPGGSAMQSTPARVDQSRNMSMMPNGNLMMNVMDRASSPFACGG